MDQAVYSDGSKSKLNGVDVWPLKTKWNDVKEDMASFDLSWEDAFIQIKRRKKIKGQQANTGSFENGRKPICVCSVFNNGSLLLSVGRTCSFVHSTWVSLMLIMVALWNRADHCIFALWFLSSFFLSSLNLSSRRLDVYHTSTHGLALVRI